MEHRRAFCHGPGSFSILADTCPPCPARAPARFTFYAASFCSIIGCSFRLEIARARASCSRGVFTGTKLHFEKYFHGTAKDRLTGIRSSRRSEILRRDERGVRWTAVRRQRRRPRIATVPITVYPREERSSALQLKPFSRCLHGALYSICTTA